MCFLRPDYFTKPCPGFFKGSFDFQLFFRPLKTRKRLISQGKMNTPAGSGFFHVNGFNDSDEKFASALQNG